MRQLGSWEIVSGATVTKRPYYATTIYPTHQSKLSTIVYLLDILECNPIDIDITFINLNNNE
jgi:hypothetical protein